MEKRAEEAQTRDLFPGDHVCLAANAVAPSPVGIGNKVSIGSGAAVILDILDKTVPAGGLGCPV